MWKTEIEFSCKENLQKYRVNFSLIPTIGYGTASHNAKIMHIIMVIWLFFSLEVIIYWENEK